MTKKVLPLAEETVPEGSISKEEDSEAHYSLNNPPSTSDLDSNTNIEAYASRSTTGDKKTHPFRIAKDSNSVLATANNNKDTTYNTPLGLTLSRVTTNNTNESDNNERMDTNISKLATQRPRSI